MLRRWTFWIRPNQTRLPRKMANCSGWPVKKYMKENRTWMHWLFYFQSIKSLKMGQNQCIVWSEASFLFHCAKKQLKCRKITFSCGNITVRTFSWNWSILEGMGFPYLPCWICSVFPFFELSFSTRMATPGCPQSVISGDLVEILIRACLFWNLLSPYFVPLALPRTTSPRWSLGNMSHTLRVKDLYDIKT